MVSPRKSSRSFQDANTPSVFDTGDATNPPPPIQLKYWFLHWIVGFLLLFATIAPVGYHIQTIYRLNLSITFSPWFRINPKDKSRYAPGKEMLPVTYFFLVFVVPVFFAAVIFYLIKTRHRGSMFYWLHLKPKCFRHAVSIGELLFVFAIVAGNVVVLYQSYILQITFGKPVLSCVAIAFGFAGLYDMVFLALPATRHCFWMEWLNLPWARAVKYHRWLGVVTIVMFVLHFLIFVVQYAKTDTLADELLPCFDCSLAVDGRDAWINVFGELSLLCMLIMGATSIPYVRRHYYSTFKMTHFLFIPAAFLAVMHYEQIIVWIFVSMVLYIVNRMYSSSTVATPVAIETAAALPGHVTQLTFKCSTTYQPGDIVYIQVPAISKVQWHPFSVASTPLHTPGLLTVYIKALGPWTSHLYDYIKQCKREHMNPNVYLDAGYTPPPTISASYASILFVGGGIGVTPLMGQIMHVLHARPHQDVYLIWHVKTVEMATQFQEWLEELELLAEKNNGRLHLNIHVTQQKLDQTTIEVHEPSRTFDLKPLSVATRPYAHISTVRKLLVLFFAFLCSGTMLVYLRYGQKFTKMDPNYWPLQRFIEFLVVVLGSYMAYGVGRVGLEEGTLPDHDMYRQPSSNMPLRQFVERFNVRFGRANWSQVFQNIENEWLMAGKRAVGVYVSGPTALSKAIYRATEGHSLYDIHVEEFEM